MKANFGWVMIGLAGIVGWTQTAAAQNISFLWVFDNGASMDHWRPGLEQSIGGFLDGLRAQQINYRMAALTTDFFSTKGELLPWPKNAAYFSDSSPTAASEFNALLESLPAHSATAFWAQGLEAAYQAILLHGPDFIQPGAPLAVIYVSDRDDYSCARRCSGADPEHNPTWVPFPIQRYVDQLQQMKNTLAVRAKAYPLVGTLDSDCQIGGLGLRYLQVQSGMGNGLSASLCPDQIAGSLSVIASDLFTP